MRTAAFVVARSRAFNLVQSAPARLLDLAKLCAILREIGSRPVTEKCAPVSTSGFCQFQHFWGGTAKVRASCVGHFIADWKRNAELKTLSGS
jgi:hypothetical protein